MTVTHRCKSLNPEYWTMENLTQRIRPLAGKHHKYERSRDERKRKKAQTNTDQAEEVNEMCGRVKQRTAASALSSAYNATLDNQATLFQPGEYSAGAQPLTIMPGSTRPQASVARWGLPAAWLPKGELLRHARAETAAGKPTFRDAASARRCIVPVDAWWEWGTRPGAERKAHEITACDGSSTGLAALWWPAPVTDMPRRIVIVTKAASGPPAQIHHRTPMVVLDEDVDAWLDPQSDTEAVRALLARPSRDEGVFEVQ